MNQIDPNGLIGLGVQVGVSAEVGAFFGVGTQAAWGIAIFTDGTISGTSLGVFQTVGGDIAAVLGTSAGVWGSIIYTNANKPSDIAGKANTTTVSLGPLSLQYSVAGDIYVTDVTGSLGPPGASISNYDTYTYIGSCD